MNPSEIVHEILIRGWGQLDFEGTSNSLHHFVLHTRGNSIELDLDKTKGIISNWKSSFPDLHFEILSIVTENEFVAVNSIMHGTHRGEWRKIPATGKSIVVPHMFFFRFDGERILEIWELNDFSQAINYLKSD